MLTADRINEFLKLSQKEPLYIEYIQNWRQMRRIDMMREMSGRGWIIERGKDGTLDSRPRFLQKISIHQMIVLKPYIELLTDYL